MQKGSPWIHALRKNVLVIAGVTLFFLIGALIASVLLPTLYRAETRVLVQALPSGTGDAALNLETEVEIIESAAVISLVEDKLRADADEFSESDLDVRPVPQTEVLEIGYVHEDPNVAAKVAQAVADAYIEFRRQRALDRLTTARAAIEDEINLTTRRLNELTRQISETTSAQEAQTLRTQRDVVTFELASLQDKLGELQPAVVELGGGEVITPVKVPRSPSSPKLLTNVALAGMMGLTLGVAYAFFREKPFLLDERGGPAVR